MHTTKEQLETQLNNAYMFFCFETSIPKKVEYKQAIDLIQNVLNKLSNKII